MNWLKKLGLLTLGLAPWYLLNGAPNKPREEYHLPEQIKVTGANYAEKDGDEVTITEEGNTFVNGEKKEDSLEGILLTKDINFNKHFEINTERYKLIKSEDWLISQICGQVMSVPVKIFFWDHNVGWGLDDKKSKAVLSMLENNSEIKDLTVRINHNEALYDGYRLFFDEKVKKRNNIIARSTLGVLICIKDELWAELFRGDYYNPMSQTVVTYSNLESIPGHEIGHHKDFQRFNSDWEYTLCRFFPPVMLYQEGVASKTSQELLTEYDQYQFNRYLIPAFLTYLLAAWAISDKFLKKKKLRKQGRETDLKEIPLRFQPKNTFIEKTRYFTVMNTELLGGIAAYSYSTSQNWPELATYAAFAGGMIGIGWALNTVLDQAIPYNYKS
ncbi:hypothetical protein HY837_06100 [archaeon]|nr:hypothetical protein [archaeon]